MKRLFFSTAVLFTLAAARVAGASTEGGHAAPGIGSLLFPLINFVLFLILLYILAFPRLKNFFVERSSIIRKALQDAEQAKLLAESTFKEYEQKLRNLDKEVQEIREMVKKEGELEKQRIIAEAGREAESLKKQAQYIAEQEVKKAKHELQREVARLSLERAEKMVREHINNDDQIRLITDYITKIAH